ncbi:hypothetical protein Hanom_Chr05g00457751 [Helianthus anomalus]
MSGQPNWARTEESCQKYKTEIIYLTRLQSKRVRWEFYLCLNHGVYDRLRMNNDFNIIVIRSIKIMGFNYFKTLVEKCCGIHCDFFTHAPVRML